MLSITSYKLHKFLPWFFILVLFLIIQCYFTSMRNANQKLDVEDALNFKPAKDAKDRPIHILLVAYARTGSSFIGDLLQSFPNSFYYFEPLHVLQESVLNGRFEDGRNIINNIFTCNISSIQNFMKWQEAHPHFRQLRRNPRYWNECSKNNTCYDGSYIDNYCYNTSIRIAKTIRLNLLEASKLFSNYPDLNLKLIYLTRDPRGTMNSRSMKGITYWCTEDPMCINPNRFCSGLHDDIKTTCVLQKQRPEDFIVLRYEDVSIDPLKTATLISRFLGFDSLPNEVLEFLKTHTFWVGDLQRKSKAEGLNSLYSTYRNSSVTSMNWRKEMSFNNVTMLQNVCRDFLSAYGYHSYRTELTLRSTVNLDSDLSKTLKFTCDAYNNEL